MGKPHKYAWNGVDIETSLSIEQIANMAQRAAQESTGDLLKGKQRVVSTRSADRQIEFRINDYLISFNKLMVFFLDFEERSGTTFASTRIEWYMTNQQTVGGFIPVSTKRMVAHHTYLQFARNLADQVRAADPSARVNLREGIESPEASAPLGAVAPQPAAPDPIAPAASIPPPPPPPPVPQRHLPPEPPHPPSYAPSSYAPPVQAPVFTAPPTPSGRADPVSASLLGLVTAVPGFSRPSASPAETPASSRTESPEPVGLPVDLEDEDLAATRRSGTKPSLLWEMELPDGASVEIREAVVVGRNPVPPATLPAAINVSLSDHTQSVSKTHATLQVRDGLVWITDLHSTNGTILTNPAGEVSVSPAGKPMPVGDGWQVGFGDFVVRLRGQ